MESTESMDRSASAEPAEFLPRARKLCAVLATADGAAGANLLVAS